MKHRRLGLNLLLFSLALAAVVGTQLLPGPDNVQADRVNPEDVCPNGGFKDESAPWEGIIAPTVVPDGTTDAGVVIISAVVKAGNDTFEYITDGANTISSTSSCYTVTGLGTCHVTVTGGGTKDCREISHVVFCTGIGTACEPEPSPSAEPSPSP